MFSKFAKSTTTTATPTASTAKGSTRTPAPAFAKASRPASGDQALEINGAATSRFTDLKVHLDASIYLANFALL